VIATASLLAAGFILAAWLYWLTDRVMRTLDRAERAAGALELLLPQVPGKSAPRTEAAEDAVEPLRAAESPRDTAPIHVPGNEATAAHTGAQAGSRAITDETHRYGRHHREDAA
jgi:hypothetical protein